MSTARRRAAVLVLGCAALVSSGCSTLGVGGGTKTGPGSLPADVDADGDGIADTLDLCPDTTFTVGVSTDGCSPFNGTVAGVVFASGGVQLGRDARSALNPLVEALLAHPDVRLEVQGHTDNRGSAEANLELSKLRVMAVVRYLVTSGVAPERLDPVAFGESRPIEKNATAEGRAANRRIEVRAIGS